MATTTRRTAAMFAVAASAAAAIIAPVAAAGPAAAAPGGGHPTVTATGSCVGGGAWKLKAKHDDGRIQVEYEVDTNRVGQVWHVGITDNGVSVFNATRTTVAPSGSFSIRLSIADRPGVDVVKAHVTFAARVCDGSANV